MDNMGLEKLIKKKIKTMETYKIVRYYSPDMNKENKIIKTGQTLSEAKEHCNREDTKKEDEWFDGYIKE